jgi:hypothetical protein
MPEAPDFDQIAHRIFRQAEVDDSLDHIVEQLRLVWNARGAADMKAVDEKLSLLAGWVTSEPYRLDLKAAIRQLDQEDAAGNG